MCASTRSPPTCPTAARSTQLARDYPDIDILVNNAGAIPGGSLLNVDEATWRKAWDLKVFGYVNMCRAFYALMQKRKRGVIVNVVGNAADTHDPEYICGVAGNAALAAFTQSLGSVSAKDGIRVVAINPGPVATDRLVTLMKRKARDRTGSEDNWKDLLKPLPFGRGASAEEIGAAIAFIASDHSGYTSGSVVTIDAGLSARAKHSELSLLNGEFMPHLTTDDGVKLYYEETGKGIPIVFIHEFAGDCRSWEQQVRHFGKYYRCITFNARGYPPSDVPKDQEKYSQERARDDIRAVLDALKIDKAHIVGLSMGGFAALHFGFTYRQPRPLDRGGGLRLRRGARRAREIRRGSGSLGQALRRADHEEGGRGLCARPDPRAAPEQGSARLARVRRPARRAFDRRRGAHHARRAEAAAIAVRSGREDEDDHGADADHDRRRGLALPRAGHPHEEEHPDRLAGRDGKLRPQHQSRGAGASSTCTCRTCFRPPTRAHGRSATRAQWRARFSGAEAATSRCSRRRPEGRRRS